MADAGDPARGGSVRSWRMATLLALAAVYGPFVVAAAVTWLFVSCDHCKQVWLEYLAIFPGMVTLTGIRSAWPGAGTLPQAATIGLAAGLSLGMVASVAACARGGGRLVLALATALSIGGAFAAYALVRA